MGDYIAGANMVDYHLPDFINALDRTDRLIKRSAQEIPVSGRYVTDQEAKAALIHLQPLRTECEKLSLTPACDEFKALEASLQLKKIRTPSELRIRVDGILDGVLREVAKVRFGFIPREKVEYFRRPDLFGELVSHAFPSTVPEIQHAGDCMAHELYDAAIFHLMRTAELGLRALARHLKVKVGKRPLESAQWGQVLREIEKKVDCIQSKPHSPRKADQIQFYLGVLREFYAFKDIWRNNVMHMRGQYTNKDAAEAYTHVRGFIQRLANRIRES